MMRVGMQASILAVLGLVAILLLLGLAGILVGAESGELGMGASMGCGDGGTERGTGGRVTGALCADGLPIVRGLHLYI